MSSVQFILKLIYLFLINKIEMSFLEINIFVEDDGWETQTVKADAAT